MTAALRTYTDHDITAYLGDGFRLDATTALPVRAAPPSDLDVNWSFTGATSWEFIGMSERASSRDSGYRPLVGPDRPEDVVVAQLSGYRDLEEGWDGEYAAKPCNDAVTDAMRFVRSVGASGCTLEPTLHVDGSVILETGEDGNASMRFKGNGTIVYATPGGVGTTSFDGYALPDVLVAAIRL